MFAYLCANVKPSKGRGGCDTQTVSKTAALSMLSVLSAVSAISALAGCGLGDDQTTTTTIPGAVSETEIPGGADATDVEVIQAWSTTLGEGDIEGAAGYFALPSLAENGPALVRIDNLEEARLFNESLPCGAELVRATSQGNFTNATFRLTERPGPGSCGQGSGHLAMTAFLIEDGEIVEWRRLPTEAQPPIDGRVT